MSTPPPEPESVQTPWDLNIPLLPPDAGKHAEGLKRILARIPEGWGRWISCGPGWYGLLVELDQKLAAIAPDYEIHQVKEKFGTLCFYTSMPALTPQCCIDVEATKPHPGPVNPRFLMGRERSLKEQFALDQWHYEVLLTHQASEEHAAQESALEPERQRRRELDERIHTIIREYENKSAVTCEECGKPGALVEGDWYRTLCSEHAAQQNSPS